MKIIQSDGCAGRETGEGRDGGVAGGRRVWCGGGEGVGGGNEVGREKVVYLQRELDGE